MQDRRPIRPRQGTDTTVSRAEYYQLLAVSGAVATEMSRTTNTVIKEAFEEIDIVYCTAHIESREV